MMTVAGIFRSDPVCRLGWVLLHSLWQIALLASVMAVLMALLRRRSANLRYVTACAGLTLACGLPVATYWFVPVRAAPETAAVSEPLGNPAAAREDPITAGFDPAKATSPAARPPVVLPAVSGAEPGRLPGVPQSVPETTLPAGPPTPLAERASQAIRPWMPWLVMAWLAGVLSLSVWHLGGWIAMERLKHLGTTPAGQQWARRLAELIERMGVSRPVRLVQSAVVDVPAVIGWLRPVLLVPVAMLGELSPQQIDAVLAHELAHIRRCDYLVNLLQTIVETLLFYHPAVWWLSRRIRIEREHCCDDAAVALCGSRVDYAAALMALEQGRLVPRLAVAAGRTRGGTALDRVRRVLGVSVKDSLAWRTSWGGTLCALLLIGTLVGYIATGAAREEGPEEKTALPTRSAQATAKLLEDFRAAKEPWIQAEAARKLIALGDKSILPEMAKMLTSDDRRERCNAGWVLAKLGDPRGLSAVLAELKDTGQRPTKLIRSDGTPNVSGQIEQDRYYAVHVLGEIGDRRAVPELIDTLNDELINYKAAIVLGSLGDRRAIPALKQMLKDCQPDRRLWAGCGLGKLGDPLGVPTVAEFLKHPQWTQRRHAAEVLGELQDKRGVAPLIDALKDQRAEGRVSAARALGKLADQSAIPALEALSDDREVTTTGPPTAVRDAAAEAIRQIRGTGNPPARAPAEAKPSAEGTAADWGPAVEGVQCRIQPEKDTWAVGEMPTCRAYIRHQGAIEVWLSTVQMPQSGLELDGVWYRHLGENITGVAYHRSSFWEKDPKGFQFSLDKEWVAVEGGKPLALGPGKHTLRYAWAGFHALYRGRISTTLNDQQRPLRLVSNPVEIEITADKIQWGQKVNGLEAGLAFDLQERPYHVGELVSFRLCVRNLAGKTTELVHFGTRGWMPTITDSAGNPVLVAGQFDGPVQRRRHTLPDGQTLLVGTVALMLDKTPDARAIQPFHAHLEPGTYRVSQKYHFADDPKATWSGELTTGELELTVLPAQDAAAEVTDLQEFRQERERGDRARDFDTKLQHYRKALKWQCDRPEKVALEYRVAVMLKEFYDSRADTWPRRKEALAMFRHIVASYDHMEYYTSSGAMSPWEAQVAVPNAATRAAWLLSAEGGDQKEAHQYLSRALDMMNQTCQRRIREWSTTPRPEPPPPDIGGLIEQSKWQSRVAEWERQKKAAAEGEVLSKSELLTVEGAIPGLDPSKGAQASPEVITRLREITESYPGTPIARIARQRLDATRGSSEGGAQPRTTGEKGAWGPAVEGVQCRLEAGKPTWKAGETPTLRAYVRHQVETRLFLSNHPMFGARLEVDGHWHRWDGPMEWSGPAHSSSRFRTKDEQPLAITLDVNWKQVENKQPLQLDPGRHVVRFVWEGHPERAPREGPDQQRAVALASNPVEITVLPDRPQPKPADLHPDERAAAAALQQLGAILAAGDQGRIRSVRLSRTAVTDADLLHLKKLSGLKALYLDDTRITDAGLAHLAGLTGLETLSLNYTRIGDAGLEHLKTLRKLRSLGLLETDVTAAGLRGLKKTLPALIATVDPLKLSGLGELRGWRNSGKLGQDYELLSVNLQEPNVTDASLARLKDHRTLEYVCLSRAGITDAGLAHLQGLTDLHTLYLSNTRVTDAGLAYVEGMKKLKSLLLADTRVGDAGLKHLEGLSQLEFLRLSGTLVSDAGLAHLSALTNLTGLDLSNCQVSGAGLGHLRALTKLTSLALSGTAVADPGLIHVQPFENLELLYLSHTSVTDAGLEYLTGSRKLRGLEIEHTAVTDEGIQRLKQALPNASIYR